MIGCAVVVGVADTGAVGNAEDDVDSINSEVPLERRVLSFILWGWERIQSS